MHEDDGDRIRKEAQDQVAIHEDALARALGLLTEDDESTIFILAGEAMSLLHAIRSNDSRRMISCVDMIRKVMDSSPGFVDRYSAARMAVHAEMRRFNGESL